MKHNRIASEQNGIIFLILIVFIIISVSIMMGFFLHRDTVAEKLGNDEVLRTLLVVEDGNSGVVLFTSLLVYYPVSKKGTVVNIPGNTGAIFHSLGRVDRIDDVYFEKGIETYVREISKLLDCSIPFYMVINIDNFSRLTDMLGGLRVFIPSPVDITSNEGKRFLLPSGAVNLDGDKIADYLRYRINEETDNEIQDRYHNVSIAFFTALHERKRYIFANKSVIKKYSSLMSVNLEKKDISRLLYTISDIDSESIIRQGITGSVRIVDNQKLMFPLNNGEFIKEALKQSTKLLVSGSGSMTGRIYVLEIKNGTTIQGLAHNTAVLFRNASYDVLSAVNADSNNYKKTIIIDHIGNPEAAKMVGEFIKCTNIVEEEIDMSPVDTDSSFSGADVDFTIILGKDFDGRYVK